MLLRNVPIDDIIRDNAYAFALLVVESLQVPGVKLLLGAERFDQLWDGAHEQIALVREYDGDPSPLVHDEQGGDAPT